MIKKVIISSLIIYIIGHVLASWASNNCKGWECETVHCPNGYAVEVPGKGYLPCEKFDLYIATENEELLR